MNDRGSKNFVPIAEILADIASMQMFLNDTTNKLIKLMSDQCGFSYEQVEKIIDEMNHARGIK